MSKLLHLDTVAHFLDEAIEFEVPELREVTMQIITHRFKHVVDAAPDFMFTIPQEVFINLIKHPELNINEEIDLVHWVRKYITYRDANAENVPQDPKEVAGDYFWSMLSEKEQADREKAYKDLIKAKSLELEKMEKQRVDDFHKLEEWDEKKEGVSRDQKKAQFLLDWWQERKNKEIHDRLKVTKCTEVQKTELFKAIRWHNITHDNLLELSQDSFWHSARAFILQGLSGRLQNFDKTIVSVSNSFHQEPRVKYPQVVNGNVTTVAPQVTNNFGNSTANDFARATIRSNDPVRVGDNIYATQRINNVQSGRVPLHGEHQRDLREAINRIDGEAREKLYHDAIGLNDTKTFKERSSPNRGSQFHRNNKSVVDDAEAVTKDPSHARSGDYLVRNLNLANTNSLSPQRRQKVNSTQSNLVFEDENMRSYSKNFLKTSVVQKAKIPQSEFVYQYDMDEHGVLNYLGTQGGQKVW